MDGAFCLQPAAVKMKSPRSGTVVAANGPDEQHVERRRSFTEGSNKTNQKVIGAEYAFYRVLSRENRVRRWCIQVTSHLYFDKFITFCIVVNSIILAIVNFSVVDNKLNPTSHGKRFENGKLVDAYSAANHVVEIFEMLTTIVFTAEFVLKVVALGVTGKGSYWKNPWNVTDFFMLFASFVAEIPGVPNISELRTVRVLRPLRSLSAFPGLRRLISALLNALPALQSVVALQMFAFLIFGILGIQLFGGQMSRVCRLTEFPVRLPSNVNSWPISAEYLERVVANASAFRCLDAPILDFSDSKSGYTRETSPWSTPQHCFWPVNYADRRLCAEPFHPGGHRCESGLTCGSNYDAFGNPRFISKKVMQDALNTAKLNWGFTTYDDIGRALLTIFQSVTEEGWTLVMYMTMDASHPAVGACFAIVLIIFASYFVMNLTIAVISEEFKVDRPARKKTRRKPSTFMWGSQKLLVTPDKNAEAPSLLRRIVTHKIFSEISLAVVFANTAVLSLDHYPMSHSMNANLELAHFIFLSLFMVEMLLKLGGLGWKNYVQDKFNLFDAAIVVSDVIEVSLLPPPFLGSAHSASEGGSVSVLRAFRLFRVFRLARRWKSFRDLLSMIANAVASIGNFGVLLFLFLYIFALVGMQLFANTMRFDEDGYPTPQNINEFWSGTVPRSNFDSLPWAIATVFQIVTGDNWSGVLYDAMRGNGMFASLYFIVLVILGDFILMNLFLALLLDNFASRSVSSATESKASNKPKPLTKRRSKISPIEANKQRIMRRMIVARKGSSDLEWQTPREGRRNSARPDMSSLNSQRSVPGVRLSRTPSNTILAVDSFQLGTAESLRTNSGRPSPTALDPPHSRSHESFSIREDGQINSSISNRGRSLFLFEPSSRVRQWAVKISTHRVFDSMMFFFIVTSSIVLAVENPLHDPESLLSKSLLMLDKVFAIAFVFEMAVKVISLGLVLHKGAYLRSSWNVIDGLVAISSVVLLFGHISSTNSMLKPLLSLRDLRALRPLRMISRRPGLKLVVRALVESIPSVLNVVFLSMVLFLLFSIAAVHFLKGAFRACSGEVFDSLSEAQHALLTSPSPWDTLSSTQQAWFANTICEGFPTDTISSEYICGCWGATWKPTLTKNFDNVGSAMLTFFILSTSENWSEIMKAACDATGPGMQPIENHNELWIVFFIAFMVVGSFFVMNVFVGVVIDNFNTMKAKLGGDFLLTAEQKKWMEAQKSARRIGPIRVLKPPPQRIRRVFFTIVRTQQFEAFVMSCVLTNTLLMAAHHFGESYAQHYATFIVSEISTGILAVEAAMKLMAYGRAYFQDRWNQFDLFVVVFTLLGTIVTASGTSSAWTLTLVVTLVRVARIFRLVESSSSIRAILSTLYISLPGLTNITSILFLILFVYATMGVHLFAKVGLTSNIDTHANFQSFGKGFLFLLRAATGESWDYCMYDLASSRDGCVDDPLFDPRMCGFSDAEDCLPLNGCGNPVAYVFFCSFTLIVAYVMLNLTVAVVLESFATSQEEQEESLLVPELLEEFQYKWAEFDPMATGFIRAEKMLVLVHSVLPPLGWFGVPLTMPQFFRYLSSLELPLYDGEQVKFRDVVLAMTKEMMRAMNNWDQDDVPASLNSARHVRRASSKRLTGFYAHEAFAARYLQRRVTKWLVTKRQLEKNTMSDFIRKVRKAGKKPRKLKKKRSETLVLTVMKEGPTMPMEVPSSGHSEQIEKFMRDEQDDDVRKE